MLKNQPLVQTLNSELDYQDPLTIRLFDRFRILPSTFLANISPCSFRLTNSLLFAMSLKFPLRKATANALLALSLVFFIYELFTMIVSLGFNLQKQKEIFKYFDLEDELRFIFQEAFDYFP